MSSVQNSIDLVEPESPTFTTGCYVNQGMLCRCRHKNHKVRNVLGHLPKAQHDQARSTLPAAWKLEADEGMRKLGQYTSWPEREWPSAAASLREGLSEMFAG